MYAAGARTVWHCVGVRGVRGRGQLLPKQTLEKDTAAQACFTGKIVRPMRLWPYHLNNHTNNHTDKQATHQTRTHTRTHADTLRIAGSPVLT